MGPPTYLNIDASLKFQINGTDLLQNNISISTQFSNISLTAAYAFGIVRNHAFLDGNKRTGFIATAVFLELNGWKLTTPEPEAVAAILALIQGDIDETGFSAWLKDNTAKQ